MTDLGEVLTKYADDAPLPDPRRRGEGMTLAPRLQLRLERCEVDALGLLRCWTVSTRRMEENRRGELGPADMQEAAQIIREAARLARRQQPS